MLKGKDQECRDQECQVLSILTGTTCHGILLSGCECCPQRKGTEPVSTQPEVPKEPKASDATPQKDGHYRHMARGLLPGPKEKRPRRGSDVTMGAVLGRWPKESPKPPLPKPSQEVL